jgi:diacylglycerol kinase (ATP)
MLYRFVINSSAGRVRTEALRDLIDREFAGLSHEVAVDPSAARLVALCGDPNGADRMTVVAVGGDGTVNRIINARPASGVVVGVIPLGTANDLATALGIPVDPAAACRIVREGRASTIDLVSVNQRRFATCGGIGLAAQAALRANRWRSSRSRFADAFRWALYPLAAARELRGWRGLDSLRIRCGGTILREETMTLVVSNQPRFGGRFSTSPEASNADGLFDLCEIRAPRSRARMFWVILRALCGRIDCMHEVALLRGSEATLVAPRAVPFFGDGELLDTARTFEIRMLPGALQVLVPSGGAP